MKSYRVTVNGKIYDVTVEEAYSADAASAVLSPPASPAPAAPSAAPPAPAVTKASAAGEGFRVESPMPGVIINILIKTGDKVVKNQPVAILEAMKMENEISAPVSGTVTSVAVAKGQSVDPGSLLATIKTD